MDLPTSFLDVLKDQRIFITGGTGTLGIALVSFLSRRYPKIRITCYSRDELKQFDLQRRFPDVHCVLGDIRDKERLDEVIYRHDFVVHLAALKQVLRGETDGSEFTKTNVLGTENVVKAAINKGVKNMLLVSSDKAVLPSSHYGATKMSGEHLIQEHAKRSEKTKFGILRLGNIWKSRGSVSELLINNKSDQLISITNLDNTRFSISAEEGAKAILYALLSGNKGEVFIPKMRAFVLKDLLAASDITEFQVVGLRKGERQHEALLTEDELLRTFETKEGAFILLPSDDQQYMARQVNKLQLKSITDSTIFSSNTAKKLSIDDLKMLIDRTMNSSFHELH